MIRPEVHLFIPCLVEDFFPDVGVATAEVLARAGARPVHVSGQTCCGQPLFKLGHTAKVLPLAKRFIELFEQAPAVVCPSGSCVHMVREYPTLFEDDPVWFERARRVAATHLAVPLAILCERNRPVKPELFGKNRVLPSPGPA